MSDNPPKDGPSQSANSPSRQSKNYKRNKNKREKKKEARKQEATKSKENSTTDKTPSPKQPSHTKAARSETKKADFAENNTHKDSPDGSQDAFHKSRITITTAVCKPDEHTTCEETLKIEDKSSDSGMKNSIDCDPEYKFQETQSHVENGNSASENELEITAEQNAEVYSTNVNGNDVDSNSTETSVSQSTDHDLTTTTQEKQDDIIDIQHPVIDTQVPEKCQVDEQRFEKTQNFGEKEMTEEVSKLKRCHSVDEEGERESNNMAKRASLESSTNHCTPEIVLTDVECQDTKMNGEVETTEPILDYNSQFPSLEIRVENAKTPLSNSKEIQTSKNHQTERNSPKESTLENGCSSHQNGYAEDTTESSQCSAKKDASVHISHVAVNIERYSSNGVMTNESVNEIHKGRKRSIDKVISPTSEEDRNQASSECNASSSSSSVNEKTKNIFTEPKRNQKKKNKKSKNKTFKDSDSSVEEKFSSKEVYTNTKLSKYDSNYGKSNPCQKSVEAVVSTSPSRPNSASDNSTAVTPLKVDTNRVVGRGRGIDGANNSCYMDATLFSLFYTTDVFDERLLTEAGCKGLPNNKLSKEIRSILKDSIVYPLRQGYFCPRDNVWKLREAMRQLNPKLCGSFMDAEEFIFHLFEDGLNVNEFIHYTSGTSDFMHQIINDTEDKRSFATVEDLFKTSMRLLEDMKLQSVPTPALILEMPRSNRQLVQYSGIVPNVQLDLDDVIVELALDNSGTDFETSIAVSHRNESAIVERPQNPERQVSSPSPPKRFILSVCSAIGGVYRKIIPNRIRPAVSYLPSAIFSLCVFIFTFFAPLRIQGAIAYFLPTGQEIDNYSDSANRKREINTDDIETGSPNASKENVEQPRIRKLPKYMDLHAVICIRGCHYTSFVKYNDTSNSADTTWLFFDSMAGGGPEVEEAIDCEKWLRRLEKEPEKVMSLWDEIPWGVKRIISDCHICIYKPSKDVFDVVSNSSYTVEKEKK